MSKSLIVILILLPGCLLSQTNIPTGATGPSSATAKPFPGSFYWVPWNFQRTYTPQKPITDTALVNLSATAEDITIATEYKDDFGRAIETVVRQASAGKKDYISAASYDQYGNVSVQYLPCIAQTGNVDDGKFKINPFYQDSAFYKNNFPDEQVVYNQTFYDGSPLNIPVKTTAPGNSWTGAGIGISYSHRANTVADSVKLWTIPITNENDVPVVSGNYLAGTMTVLQTTDEKGNISLKYLDALGRTILTKVQNVASPSTGHYGWLCTYYVYDEMNHLRLVITPNAVEALNTTTVNWNLSAHADINTGLCYGYYYDNRGRVVMKRIPGKSKQYIAYDLFDRIVMTQDSNLRRTNQWAFVLYDGQSRPNKTGLITTSLIKDSILAQAARSTNYPSLTGTYTILTETYYDDYSWISGSGSSLSGSLITTNINSTNFITSYNSSPDYAQPVTQSNRIRGAVTGTKRLIVNSSSYLFSVNIYDDHGRSIQTAQTNYSGGTDVATIQYAFSGRVLRSHLAQQKSGTNAQTHTLLTKYGYDHMGRVKSVTKNLDNTTDKTISQNTYNELGQLMTKSFGSSMETQNYSYNIRGWLLGINSSYINTAGSTSNYFGESLFYDWGFTGTQLNGNIAGVKWKAYGDGIPRVYGYGYDRANRLNRADFAQNTTGSWDYTTMNYSVWGFDSDNGYCMKYDANGNILSMIQGGWKVGGSTIIDAIHYAYFPNSNKLQQVWDNVNDSTSTLGDLHYNGSTKTATDYSYDANGNINTDYNRQMRTSSGGPGAVFNVLDKPDSISMNGHAGIHYYYDAAGNLLRKQVNDYTPGASPATRNYLYLSGFVYLNDTLQYVLHDEGRIRWAKKTNSSTGAVYYAYEYDYFIKDHLGNVRTVLTEGKDTATYAATMETKDSAVVQALFKNVYDPVRTVYAKPTAFDTDTSNHFVARLNASAGINIKTGPSLILKVMAGDKVQASVYSYYTTPVQPPPGGVSLLADILAVLGQGVINNSGGHLAAGDLTGVNNALNPNVLSFLNTGRSYDNTKPKAYLNWILFDDQFNYVASNSGVQQVQPGTSAQVLSAPLQTISKNGYLYVYVSNESQQDVYFDKLTVKHYTGPLSQEQSFYPFGLQMAGISDKALLKQTNPYKFNGGTELEEDGGLNYYNTFYRKYDPQIGRFTGVDMLSEKSYGSTPYHFGLNNPIYLTDFSGAKEEKANYAEYWNEFFWEVGDLFGPERGSNRGYAGDGGIGYGVNFYHKTDGNWGINKFESEEESFAYGAELAFNSGYWGSGRKAIDGYNHAQDVYEGITGVNPGLMTPVTAEGRIWDYEGKTVINITNMDEIMRQLGKNGAYQWANYFNGAPIREGINTSLELTDQIALRTINFGFKYGNYSKGLNVTEGITRGFALFNMYNTFKDAAANPNGWQTHNYIDFAATLLTLIPGFGQAFGALWFVGNVASELISGKSISEHIQEEWDPKQ